jgi:hypothetical protein
MTEAHLPATVAALQADGLWLIGIGALLLTVVGIATRPLRLHLQFGSLGDERRDRLAFAGTVLGLAATAIGSVLVAIGSTPAVWFIIATTAGLLLMGWIVLAWRVRSLWMARRDEAAMKLKQNQDLAREDWQLQATVLLSRWRWALRHALTRSDATGWPYDYLTKRIGAEPPGVSIEWYSNDGRLLRRNRPSLVEMSADEAPDWLHAIVLVATSEKWIVLRSGQFLVFYTPDGLRYTTVEASTPTVVQGLARMALLRKLKELGLPTHTGDGGQPLPGRDMHHLVSVLVQESASGPGEPQV